MLVSRNRTEEAKTCVFHVASGKRVSVTVTAGAPRTLSHWGRFLKLGAMMGVWTQALSEA